MPRQKGHQYRQEMDSECSSRKKRTPRLNIEGDNRLGGNLGLGSLLLAVGSQTLLTDTGSLGILLLVVRAEQVDIIVVLSGGGLGGVQGDLGDLRAVDGVGLAGIALEGGELILVCGNVLVPTGSSRVLGGVGSLLEGLEDGDVGLAGREAIFGGGGVSEGCFMNF